MKPRTEDPADVKYVPGDLVTMHGWYDTWDGTVTAKTEQKRTKVQLPGFGNILVSNTILTKKGTHNG